MSNQPHRTPLPRTSYAIAGIPGAPSRIDFETYRALCPRREVTAFWNDTSDPDAPIQKSLMIQGLVRFKQVQVDDYKSFFQTAAIHCFPGRAWPAAPDPPSPPRGRAAEDSGWCHHNRVTFPNWHRPYMVLFEQLLFEHMTEALNEETFETNEQKQQWQTALQKWRLPYWDFGLKSTDASYNNGKFGLPRVFTQPDVDILRATGALDTVHNPLTGFINPMKDEHGNPYAFGNADKMMGYDIPDDGDGPDRLPWSQCTGTSRYGITRESDKYCGLQGVNRFDFSNQTIDNHVWSNPFRQLNPDHPPPRPSDDKLPSSIADAIYRVLTYKFSSYTQFASTVFIDEFYEHHKDTSKWEPQDFTSLEFLHNNMHNFTGGVSLDPPSEGKGLQGLGHMSDVPVAAFDPIFYFYHGNIERLFAMWQVMNDGKWLDDHDATSSLMPFYVDEQSHFWNAADTKDIWRFNYTYDTLLSALQEDCLNKDGSINFTEWSVNLKDLIFHLYGGSGQAAAIVPDEVAKTKEFDDYVINVIYDRYALDGTAYSISFFTGHPPEYAALNTSDKNYVGQLYTFSYRYVDPEGESTCANCEQQREDGILSTGQIPLTIPLMAQAANPAEAYNEITSVRASQRKEVEDYLSKYLTWQYSQTGYGVLSSDVKFPKTKVFVLRRNASVQTDATKVPAPAYGDYEVLVGITQGKEGGGTQEDCDRYFPGIPQVV